jgi:hypothetical protein
LLTFSLLNLITFLLTYSLTHLLTFSMPLYLYTSIPYFSHSILLTYLLTYYLSSIQLLLLACLIAYLLTYSITYSILYFWSTNSLSLWFKGRIVSWWGTCRSSNLLRLIFTLLLYLRQVSYALYPLVKYYYNLNVDALIRQNNKKWDSREIHVFTLWRILLPTFKLLEGKSINNLLQYYLPYFITYLLTYFEDFSITVNAIHS